MSNEMDGNGWIAGPGPCPENEALKGQFNNRCRCRNRDPGRFNISISHKSSITIMTTIKNLSTTNCRCLECGGKTPLCF